MKINEKIENLYGPQCSSDSVFTGNARLLQSYYRFIVLKEKSFGIGPQKKSVDKKTKEPSYYGNMLLKGEISGKNFLFNETFEYAKMRVAHKLKDETIEPYRLFNNMLSSMPMAFNLFHPLMMIKEKHPEKLNRMIQDVFPNLPVHHVEEIKIEFIPIPIESYTNDKSAMDAAILFKDEKENLYLIAIETKYTDSLGTNTASDNVLKLSTAKGLNQFTDDGLKLIEGGCPQLYRNYLLTEKYTKVQGLADSFSIILAPEKHPSTSNEIFSLKSILKPQFQYKIEKYDLESFIEILKINCPEEFKDWLINFEDRYLNFELAEKILKR